MMLNEPLYDALKKMGLSEKEACEAARMEDARGLSELIYELTRQTSQMSDELNSLNRRMSDELSSLSWRMTAELNNINKHVTNRLGSLSLQLNRIEDKLDERH